jgi:hypothetical protein
MRSPTCNPHSSPLREQVQRSNRVTRREPVSTGWYFFALWKRVEFEPPTFFKLLLRNDANGLRPILMFQIQRQDSQKKTDYQLGNVEQRLYYLLLAPAGMVGAIVKYHDAMAAQTDPQ